MISMVETVDAGDAPVKWWGTVNPRSVRAHVQCRQLEKMTWVRSKRSMTVLFCIGYGPSEFWYTAGI